MARRDQDDARGPRHRGRHDDERLAHRRKGIRDYGTDRGYFDIPDSHDYGYGEYGDTGYEPPPARAQRRGYSEPRDSAWERERDYRGGGFGSRDEAVGRDRDWGRTVRGQDDEDAQPSYRGRGPRGYQRSDERLREVICERLTEDHYVDPSDVAVEVKDGDVTLEGTVSDRRAKYHVEEIVDACGGVGEIHNRLRIRGRGRGDAAQ